MLKTISAAVIAVSMLAAPAFAGGVGHAARAPHSHQHDARVLDAKAQMHRGPIHHHRHLRPHFNLHKKFGMHKTFTHSAHTAKTVHPRG